MAIRNSQKKNKSMMMHSREIYFSTTYPTPTNNSVRTIVAHNKACMGFGLFISKPAAC